MLDPIVKFLKIDFKHQKSIESQMSDDEQPGTVFMIEYSEWRECAPPTHEKWIQDNPDDILDILTCPTMKWLKTKPFIVSSQKIGSSEQIIHLNFEPDDSFKKQMKKLKKSMAKKYNNLIVDVDNLYQCSKCNKILESEKKCCGQKMEKIEE